MLCFDMRSMAREVSLFVYLPGRDAITLHTNGNAFTFPLIPRAVLLYRTPYGELTERLPPVWHTRVGRRRLTRVSKVIVWAMSFLLGVCGSD